jgi:CRP-like cAMP-binding protein
MTQLLVSKLRWTATYAETVAQYDAAGRLLHILILYNEQSGVALEPGKKYLLDLALNQADLGSFIGARREWVNRLLREWRERGLLEYDAGKIVFLDLPKVMAERDSRIEPK